MQNASVVAWLRARGSHFLRQMTWGGAEKADQEFDFSHCQVCGLLDAHIAGVEWPVETKVWNLRNRAGSEVDLGSHPCLNMEVR